jgi:hypothetical protein
MTAGNMVTNPTTGVTYNSKSMSVDMNALQGGIVDRVTGFYYYTLELAAGALLAPVYNLFNAFIGQPDPYPLVVGDVLTETKTNMLTTCNQGFQPPWDIVVDSIGIECDPMMAPADIDLITRYSYFKFSILQKMQWEGKLEAYPAGMGISGATSQNAQSQWNVGDPTPLSRKRFGRYGKYLGPQTMWNWDLFFPANAGPVAAGVHTQAQLSSGGIGAVIRFYLFGLLDRPVT